MGYHRDPRHFPLHPWVAELRRRAWSHLCCVQALAVRSYGADPNLSSPSDTAPPSNVDDGKWCPSQYAGPRCVPTSMDRFTDMTFALVHRQLADLSCQMAKTSAVSSADRGRLISEAEDRLNQMYFRHMDRSQPTQAVVFAFSEERFLQQRLLLRHEQAVRTQQGHARSRYQSPAFWLRCILTSRQCLHRCPRAS